jgi:hypothetical protein
MTEDFEKWSKNYQEYIDPWYDKFVNLFASYSLEPPTKRDFYFHCYINTRDKVIR